MSYEADKPRDSFEIPSLEEVLHKQLQEVIGRSKQSPTEEEWTPEEQAELNSELAKIPFSSVHANPDFSDRTVTVGGEATQIHAYNNFPMILSVVDMLRHSKKIPQLPPVESTYLEVANERRYPEIFGALEAAYPAIYKRTKQIFSSRGQTAPPGPELSADEKAFVQSQAYSAAAHLAQEVDPNYNLDFLRK